MPIPVSSPVEQPAANFTGWWITNVTIVAISPLKPASARVTMIPYDPTTGVTQVGGSKTFVISDLFGAALVDPVSGVAVGAASTALIAAIHAVAAQKSLL